MPVANRRSVRVVRHFRSHRIVTSELTRWELFRVLARKESEGGLPAGTARDTFERFLSDVAARAVVLAPMDTALEARFRQRVPRLLNLTPQITLRTFDGIHRAPQKPTRLPGSSRPTSNAQGCGGRWVEALPVSIFIS